MTRIARAFSRRKALITYITVGDPSLTGTEKLIFSLEKAGADIIELGIPFSDPIADGPVIQASHQRALKKNVAIADALKIVKKARKKSDIPICFMLSYNLIVKYGEERFFADCASAGVDGAIVPDLPPEEAKTEAEAKVDRVYLIAPTSTAERIRLAAERSSGFIYMISVAGITGARSGLSGDLPAIIGKVREYTDLPVAIGFGISTPAQAQTAARCADGVIVGSALVDLIAKKKTGAALKLVASMRKAIDAVR